MTPRGTTAVESFDVREYARTARGSHRAEIDGEAIAAAGLAPDAVHLIRVLRDLERGTLDLEGGGGGAEEESGRERAGRGGHEVPSEGAAGVSP